MSESYKSFKEAYEALYGPVKEQKSKDKPVISSKGSFVAPKRKGRSKAKLPDKTKALMKYDSRAVISIDDLPVTSSSEVVHEAVPSNVAKIKTKKTKRPVIGVRNLRATL